MRDVKTTHRYRRLDADPLRSAANDVGATLAAAVGDLLARSLEEPEHRNVLACCRIELSYPSAGAQRAAVDPNRGKAGFGPNSTSGSIHSGTRASLLPEFQAAGVSGVATRGIGTSR